MREVTKRDDVDGRDLLKITNQTIGTDVKRLVADFQFPQPGLRLTPITPALALNKSLEAEDGLFVDAVEPNSPGAAAGLKPKDIILTANSVSVVSELDFEQALFQAEEQQSIPLRAWRKDEGTIDVEMPLRMPDGSVISLKKRRNPLKKGRIDVLGSSLLIP